MMGRSFYEKNNYIPDGKEKIFKRWNKKEIRYVKVVDQTLNRDSGCREANY